MDPMKSPFNSYNDRDERMTITGNRTTRIADENLLHNLRHTWGQKAEHLSDAALINLYDEFALSEDWGDNDAKFEQWLKEAQ
jgi:hypothetical protein